MADRWSQSGHHSDAGWQHPEDSSSLPPGSAPSFDAQLYPYEPSYPINGRGSTRSLPFERVAGSNAVYRNTNSPEVRSGSTPSTAGFFDEQILPNGSGVASYGCRRPSGSYVPIDSDTIPTSPYHSTRLNADIQPSKSVTYGEGSPRAPHFYDATVSSNPTVLTTDSGSWYYNALSPTSTADPSDSVPNPNGSPHMYKEVVASESVIGASARRRKPESAARYQCTGFGTCSSTFTTNYNLQNHQNSHLGIKPYQCDFCDARAVTKSDIKRHERTCKARFSSMGQGPSQGQ